MHGFGVLGSEPLSWGSLAVGGVVGYGLAMLVSRASQSSGPVSGLAGLGAPSSAGMIRRIEAGRRILMGVREILRRGGAALPPTNWYRVAVDPRAYGHQALVELYRVDVERITAGSIPQTWATIDSGVSNAARWLTTVRGLPQMRVAGPALAKLIQGYYAIPIENA